MLSRNDCDRYARQELGQEVIKVLGRNRIVRVSVIAIFLADGLLQSSNAPFE